MKFHSILEFEKAWQSTCLTQTFLLCHIGGILCSHGSCHKYWACPYLNAKCPAEYTSEPDFPSMPYGVSCALVALANHKYWARLRSNLDSCRAPIQWNMLLLCLSMFPCNHHQLTPSPSEYAPHKDKPHRPPDYTPHYKHKRPSKHTIPCSRTPPRSNGPDSIGMFPRERLRGGRRRVRGGLRGAGVLVRVCAALRSGRRLRAWRAWRGVGA